MRLRGASLGFQLNIALLVFLLVLGAATSAIIIYGFNRTQDHANDRSREALEEEGKLALLAVVGGASEQGGLQFETVAETGQRAALYLDTVDRSGAPVAFDTSRLARTAAGVYYDPDPNRTSDLVILNGGSPDDAAVQDDLAFSAPLNAVFPVLLEGFAGEVGGANLDPIAMVFISTNSATRYYPPVGIHEALPPEVDIAPRMELLGSEKNPERRTIWTEPYEDAAGQGQLVTARTPVYDGDTFRGSLEVDLSIEKLIDQVNAIHPTPGGFAFYVDSAGTLWRSAAFDLLSRDAEVNPELAAVLDAMKANEGEIKVEKLELEGEGFYIAYAPLLSLGGSFAVAAPVSEVTAQAATITAGIDDEGNRTFRIMLAAMSGLFVAGLAGASYLNRRVLIRPIQQLAAATRSVAEGDLDTKVTLHRGDELGALAESFNAMVEQLRESERLLEQRVEDRTRELQALLRADTELFRSLDLDEVLQALVDVAVDILGVHKSLVSIWDPERGKAVVRAVRNIQPDSLAVLQGWLANLGHSGPANDYPPMFYDADVTQILPPELLEVTEREGVKATTDIPIRSPQGTVLGGFGVMYTEPHTFSEDEQRVLVALADRAVVAISNAELYRRAQEAASLEERQRLARELHDSVSQALYGIALGARTARTLLDQDPAKAKEPVEYVLSLAEAGLAEMRALIFELRPESLESEGIVEALRKQVAATHARFGMEVETTLCEEPDIPIEVKEALYRIAQEALHNVVKHAKAQHAAVSLRHENGAVTLEVRDDGVGFDPAGDFAGHLGLRSMRERAAKAGGTFAIESAPGSGTVVRLGVPQAGEAASSTR